MIQTDLPYDKHLCMPARFDTAYTLALSSLDESGHVWPMGYHASRGFLQFRVQSLLDCLHGVRLSKPLAELQGTLCRHPGIPRTP